MKTFKEFQDKFTKKAEKLLKKKFTKDEEIEQTISLIGEMLQDLARDLYNELPFEQIKTSKGSEVSLLGMVFSERFKQFSESPDNPPTKIRTFYFVFCENHQWNHTPEYRTL